jgi:uncharacterized protein YbjT (DUF2867 family)
LVLGGTGHYGAEIVRALLRRGVAVRVMSRDPIAARRKLSGEVETVGGDIEDISDLDRALDGVGALAVAVSAFAPKTCHLIERIEGRAVISAFERAAALGVERVLYLSVYEPRSEVMRQLPLGAFGEIARIKRTVEEALAATELNWTVFGCPPSMEMFFAFLRGSVMVVPGGGPASGIPTLASRDLGELAAQALVRRDLAGQRFRLTGSEPIAFPEAARRLSAVTGRRIRFLAPPLLPLKLAAALSKPFYPYLQFIRGAVILLNNFPGDLIEKIPGDHARLLDTFDFVPTTLEDETRRRMALGEL